MSATKPARNRPSLSGWKPRTVTTRESVDLAPVAALAALLDLGAGPPKPGDVLPPLWHWAALAHWSASSALGPDGHPRRGDFLPPVELPRRMFAGGQVRWHGDLTIGSEIIRRSAVESVESKTGRSGRFSLVRVNTTLESTAGELLVEEHQDLIYRPRSKTRHRASDLTAGSRDLVKRPLAPTGKGWRFRSDPTVLMRFSAATANAHRIHYDWPYATRVEGYPGLLVQGPLLTLAMAEVLRLSNPSARVHELRHRNTAPLYCGETAHISLSVKPAEGSSEGATVHLRDPLGGSVAHLSAELETIS